MDQKDLERFIKDSFQEGYKTEEIIEILKEENVSQEMIKRAIQDFKREEKKNHQSRHRNVISNIDLTDNNYIIKQRFFFNRYHIYDQSDELVLKAKQKLFKLKEDFPFLDSENNEIFHVKADSIIDAAGDYGIIDEGTGNTVISLDRKYTLFRHKWRIRDPESEELLARIESKNQTVETLRIIGNLIPYLPNLFGFIPHSYVVENRDGEKLAELEGKLSIRDIYELNILKTESIPKEALIAGTISIDALEGN